MPTLSRSVSLAVALAASLASGAIGAGERALLPLPTGKEAAEGAGRIGLLRVLLNTEGSDANHELIGRVKYFQNGVPRDMYVVSPGARGGVGEVAELDLTPGPGLPITFTANAEVVVGTKGLTNLADAVGAFERAGVRRELRPLAFFPGVYTVRTASALEAFEVAESLLALPFVSFAHPDGVSAKSTLEPRNPMARARGTGGADAAPDVNVLDPDGMSIASGGAYNIGTTQTGFPLIKTLAIENTGDMPLTVNNVAVPQGFTVLTQPPGTINPGAAAPVVVRLDGITVGTVAGPFTFGNNDPDENPYTFTITGTVTGQGGTGIGDPLFSLQWHLENTGQGPTGSAVFAGFDINVRPAWELTLGEGARVAVMDDGCQPDHPDYIGNVLPLNAADNVFDAPSSFNRGPGSHGTSVSGCVAAVDNNLGVRGSAPRASLMLSSSFYQQLTPTVIYASDALVATRINNAVSSGAFVHTNSWSFVDPTFLPDVIRTAIQNGYTTGRTNRGVLFLFAAGNSGIPVEYNSSLASMPETVAVAAISNQGRQSTYSSFGDKIEYASPSNGGATIQGQPAPLRIQTTDVTDVGGYNNSISENGGDYNATFGGTSAATPISAGVAALIFSSNPELLAVQVRRILRHTSRTDITIGNSFPFDTLASHAQGFGAGLIDAEAAVNAARESLDNGGLTWPAPPTGIIVTRLPTSTVASWANPPTTKDGEYGGFVLVLRYSAGTAFKPGDGLEYAVGSTPDVGVRVIASGDITTFTDAQVGMNTSATYGIFTRNAAGKWSRPGIVRVYPEEPITVFADNFETDTGWTVPSVEGGPTENNEWERGTPGWSVPPFVFLNAAHSGANAFVTDLDDTYAGSNTEHILLSPEIDLTATNPLFGRPITSASVSWWELVDSIGGGADTMKVEALDASTITDGVGGGGGEPQPLVLKTLVSKNTGLAYQWRQRWFDLRGQRGKKIVLRFTLSTSLPNALSGWYIDDIRVGASVNNEGPITPGRPRRIVLPPSFIGLIDEFFSPAPDADPDLDGSGSLDTRDLAAMLATFGSTPGEQAYIERADLDADGRIGMADLVLFLSFMAEQAHATPQ